LSSIEGYEKSAERRFESCLDEQREDELEKCKQLTKHNNLTRSQKDELARHIRSLQKEVGICLFLKFESKFFWTD